MASVNLEQIERVAGFLKDLPLERKTLNFYSLKEGEKETVLIDSYPRLYHPQNINFFFFNCMHQFGFWYGDQKGYFKPLYGLVSGKEVKGSDLLNKITNKALLKNPLVFIPEKLAEISLENFISIFSDDRGPVPFPDLEERFKLTRSYGRWFKDNHTSPGKILYDANKKENPLKEFISATTEIPGFNGDKLQKKNYLLAMVLANRPEKLLNIGDEKWKPVIDYHLMRLHLRLGTVDLDDGQITPNMQRLWVSPATEKDIRKNSYKATVLLMEKSGKDMPELDSLLWNARKYCPEMAEPDCENCILGEICKKQTKFFQPVFRTTNY